MQHSALVPERYCPDPPVAPENGGISSWDIGTAGRTRFGTTITYTCGEARQLMRQDEEGYTVYYDEFQITCLWNRTYDKNPTVVSLVEPYG